MSAKNVTIHAVLAGAYQGGRKNLEALAYHASIDGGDTALCGQTNLADEFATPAGAAVTCKRCISRQRWV